MELSVQRGKMGLSVQRKDGVKCAKREDGLSVQGERMGLSAEREDRVK